MTKREKELADQGWKRKTTTDQPRLSELARAYRLIGCDVHLEPFDPAEQPGCRACVPAATNSFHTIYIRPAGNGDHDMDSLSSIEGNKQPHGKRVRRKKRCR